MRIVSFLPSATEMLFALGLEDFVVGVTFECDYPTHARRKPQVVHSHLPPGLTPTQIDSIVRAEGAQGKSLYFADFALLEELAPDLILLQDLCRVCAIDTPTMARELASLSSQPRLLSLSAGTLDGVFLDIERVGEATGYTARAVELTNELRARVTTIAQMTKPTAPPRVLALEWLDPFFQGGHWIPEMISLAGGTPVLAKPGEKSVRLDWAQIQEADPDMIVVMPCGYHLEETVAQYKDLTFPAGWHQLRAVQRGCVFAVDGSAYFSRPGPRLVDGMEILAKLMRGLSGSYVPLLPDRSG